LHRERGLARKRRSRINKKKKKKRGETRYEDSLLTNGKPGRGNIYCGRELSSSLRGTPSNIVSGEKSILKKKE